MNTTETSRMRNVGENPASLASDFGIPAGIFDSLSLSQGTVASVDVMTSNPEIAFPARTWMCQPQRARRHDAMVELYREHYVPLVRLARFVAHDPSSAEDLVHDAFIKFYGSYHRVHDKSRAPAYLRTTLVNLARGLARRHHIAQRRQDPAPTNTAPPEEGALGREDSREVIDALRDLPARQRECLVLRHYEGMSEREIAATLNISVGSVRTHAKRGIAALEARLRGLQ